ncbi:MAG: nuclear transport factor 2 family protein [Candidatus Scalindua sp.]|nr:nuclear transport factor 2 family protein [Candidatus Scalindua sp.]
MLFKGDAFWSPVDEISKIDCYYEEKWIEGLNQRDVTVADKIFDPDCKIYITGEKEHLNVDKFKKKVEGDLKNLPTNTKFKIVDQIIGDNKFAFRWEANGSDAEKEIRKEGLIIDHIAKGKIVKRWERYD